jgi:hypothetical protein
MRLVFVKKTGLLCSKCFGDILFAGENKYHVTFTCECKKERSYIEDVDDMPLGLKNWLYNERIQK